jgi:ribosomal protein S18 acetylase RimI-like enzyme
LKLNFNLSSNNAILLFREKSSYFFTSLQKKIFVIAALALGFLTAYCVHHYFFRNGLKGKVKKEVNLEKENLVAAKNKLESNEIPLSLKFKEEGKTLLTEILLDGNRIGGIKSYLEKNSLGQDYLHVFSVLIEEQHQGKGYGKKVTSEFVKFLDSHPKFSKLEYYQLETHEQHEAAVRVFFLAGFRNISHDDSRWPEDTAKGYGTVVMIRSSKHLG